MKTSVEKVYLLFIAKLINVAGLMFGRKFTVLFCAVESLQHLTLMEGKKQGSFLPTVQ